MKNKNHIFLLLFCVVFFIYQYAIRSAVPNVLNEDLQKYFGINATQIGSLFSFFYLAYTIMQVPTGIIMDRISAKWLAIFAFLIFSLETIAFVSTQNFLVAAISQFLLGSSASFSFLLVMKVTNDNFSREKVALISSVAVSAGSLGPVIGSTALAHLSLVFPWKDVVLYVGFLGIFCSLLGLIFLKNNDAQKNEKSNENVLDKRLIIHDLKLIFANSQYFWIGLFSMAMLGPISTFCDAWGISFVMHVYGFPKEQAAFTVSLIYAGTIIGGPLAAYLSKILKSYKKVMLGGAICIAILLSLIIFVRIPSIILYIALFLTGIIISCQFLAFPAALSLAPKSLGATLTGVVNTITMLGSTILISGVGFLLDFSKGPNETYSIQDYKFGFTALVISIFIAMFALIFVKVKYPTKEN